jgi:Sulfotransferase domain
MFAQVLAGGTSNLRGMTGIKVLSVVGPGRSGTTILAAVLGEFPRVVDVGELRWLWQRGVLERRVCGCGLPPDECPVWSEVLDKVVAPEEVPLEQFAGRVAAAQRVLISRRHRIRVIRRAASRRPWKPVDDLRAVTGRLIGAVSDVTGARVVVDSSKRAQDAALFAGLEGVEHYVLHVVRDPGAVAFSWGRGDKTVRLAEGTRAMGTRGLLSSLSRWTENTLGSAVLRPYVPSERWMFLRYEDFARDPRGAVEKILTFLGEAPAGGPFVTDDTVELHVNHTVAGNPNRFKVGRVTIRLDDEWTRRMPPANRLAVRALMWPFLLRYRYPVRRPVRAAG